MSELNATAALFGGGAMEIHTHFPQGPNRTPLRHIIFPTSQATHGAIHHSFVPTNTLSVTGRVLDV